MDLRSSTSEDPEWLKDVRKEEVQIIGQWISEYNNNKSSDAKEIFHPFLYKYVVLYVILYIIFI